ncbi:MAG TPA: OmpA family protein [Flavobacteriales bacterium]|nr:OmpA family protein [Flavobacteriales bacterium]HMR28721.1 OmpA family protein [Flavobacteriales bacterium]
MRTSMFLACLSAGLLFSTVAMGQTKLAEEADAAFNKGYYFNAIELYKKAYTTEKKASDKAALIFKVGECYRVLGDAQQAAVWYEKANKAQYSDPITYFHLGEALKEQGKYAEAIAAYNKYKEKNPGDTRADAGINACQVAQQWKDNPSRYSVDPEVLLNSQQYDFTPGFSDKKNEDVVFTSTRAASTGTNTDQIIGEAFSDLFASSRDKLGKWSEPVKLPPSINTEGNEGAPTFNSKRSIMYFTRCAFEKNKVHGCEIWMTKKVGSNYSEPELLALRPANAGKESKLDTPVVTLGHPALSPDDQTLFFSSNMKGGKGGKDIWMVKLDKDGKPVGAPTNLGGEINTKKDEMFPFNRQDGSLYFSSDGHPGMGGMDIYRAEKTGDNTWGQVENVKYPINSPSDDFGIIFDGEEERGYFTSNRPGGKGQDDIWRFYMPDLVFALQGTVYDKETSTPLPGAKIEVVGTDGTSYNALADDNGGFSFAENGRDRFIKENTTYTIRVSKDEYLVVNDQITTVGLDESTTFVKEYFLQPARKDVVIKMPEVQYELGSFALTQAGKDSLEFLYATLTENPTIVIELAAHTDSRDTDKRNQVLSENRAKSCVNYLVSKGIDPARMQAVGYGESKLRISDAEIAKMKTREEQEAAHQMNRRTEFRVLSFDHVPKEQPAPAPAPNN